MRLVVAGAGGYVGRILVGRLVGQGHDVVALGRRARALPTGPGITSRVVDVGDEDATAGALAGSDAAYYLVPSITDGGDGVWRYGRAPSVFGRAAAATGLQRIVALGALGPMWTDGVGAALAASGVPVVELRASVILGPGSVAFEILRHLTERLPVIVCPKWMRTPLQPIAHRDVLEYLERGLSVEPGVYEIGGADVTSYAEMMAAYARVRGLRPRRVVDGSMLTPRLSPYWIDLVTPVDHAASRPLVESLRAELVVRDGASAAAAFDVAPARLDDALQAALDDEAEEVATRLETLARGRHHGVYVESVDLPIEAGLPGPIDAGFSQAGEGQWVVARREPGVVVLRAVRRLPGDVWLGSFVREPDSTSGDWRLRAVGAFRPRGLAGFASCMALAPLHRPLFTLLARRRVKAARRAAPPAPPARF